jgi:hypothetical protein
VTAKPFLLNFSFERNQEDSLENFIDCPDLNPSGMTRFHPCILATVTLTYDHIEQDVLLYTKQNFTFGEQPNPYVIASGVRHHPDNWTTPRGKKNLFEWLNPTYLKDLQEGRAVLLLDQCLEGYHTPYLWQWFHDSCSNYNIPPEAVIYVTGNWKTAQDYEQWSANKDNKIKTIPFTHFESYVQFITEKSKIYTDWNDNIAYKKSNTIKTFNCLQKRLRSHRIWFYIKMFEADILDLGLVSMNDYRDNRAFLENKLPDEQLLQEARSVLPLEIYGKSNAQYDDSYYINRIVDQVYKDTWVSVVSEPIFADSDNALFISEKTFKPIACMHPFIILGGKGSLQAMRDMGYKTFDGFINEDYDNLSTFDRIDAIIKEIKRIDAIEDKLGWFESMREIIEHNYKTFHESKHKRPAASTELVNYCKEYFNV